MRRVLTLLMGLFFFCTFHAQEVVRYVTANLNLRDSPTWHTLFSDTTFVIRKNS